MKLHQEDLQRLVGSPYFERGKAYFKDGLIKFVSIDKAKVTARAAGTGIYTVMLWYKKNELDGTCTCVAFREHGPCKHIAATGLALIQHNAVGYKPSQEFNERSERLDEFERFLAKQTKQELVTILLEVAQQFPETLEEMGYMESEYC